MSFDIDRLLYHAVQAGTLTESSAKIAKKIYRGQRIKVTAVPGLMCLDDGTAVTADDLKTFERENLAGLLVHGAAKTLAEAPA